MTKSGNDSLIARLEELECRTGWSYLGPTARATCREAIEALRQQQGEIELLAAEGIEAAEARASQAEAERDAAMGLLVDCQSGNATKAWPRVAELSAENARLRRDVEQLRQALKAIVEHELIDGHGIRYEFDYNSPLGKQARAALTAPLAGKQEQT
jgi:multidrug resistance efflux pump